MQGLFLSCALPQPPAQTRLSSPHSSMHSEEDGSEVANRRGTLSRVADDGANDSMKRPPPIHTTAPRPPQTPLAPPRLC